jgi:hypothetical protein
MRELLHGMLLGVVVLGLLPSLVSAQSTAASLSGTIYDEQHGVLSGASVILRSTETERTHATFSNRRGMFQLVELPPLNVILLWDHDDGTVILQHKHAVAPRLGVAWSPWADGQTIVRGGYGTFYDRVLLGVARSAKNAFVQTLVTNPGYPDPFGYNPSRTGEAFPPSTTRFAQDVSTPYTE